MRVKKENLLLIGILAATLGMRILVIKSDLPGFLSLDEVTYIESGLRFGAGSFSMSSYMHGALYQMVLFVEFGIYFVLGRMLGLFSSSTDFVLAYIKDPTPFFLLARGTVVLCSLGVVGLSYAIASRIYHPRVGLAASLFTAFSLLMFQMSFLALADIPSVFLLMLATYFAVRSVEQPKERKLYYAAAMLIGLAAAAKYHTGFGVVTLYTTAFLKCGDYEHRFREFVRLAVLGSVFAALGFCIGMPQALVYPAQFYEDVFRKLSGAYLGYNQDRNAWLFIFTHHLRNGLGIPLELASLLGLGFALYNRSRWDLLMLSFPVSFYLLFMHSVGWAYHLLPAVPFLLILAARVLDAMVGKLLRREYLAASVVLATVVMIPTFLDSLRFMQVMGSPSTRVLAKKWIEQYILAESTIMAEGYIRTTPTFGPPLLENSSTLQRDMEVVMKNKGTGRFAAMQLAQYEARHDNARTYDIFKVDLLDSDAILRNDPQYLIMTSAMDHRPDNELATHFMIGNDNERHEALKKAMQHRDIVKGDIRRRYAIMKTIGPTDEFTAFFPHLTNEDYELIRTWPVFSQGRSRGPTISIWERRSHHG